MGNRARKTQESGAQLRAVKPRRKRNSPAKVELSVVQKQEPRKPRKRKVDVLNVLPPAVRAIFGAVIGFFAPMASYNMAHEQLPNHTYKTLAFWVLLALILGCLAFSAKTVWQWANAGFQDKLKAFGFCVFLEGVMVYSEVPWLSWFALGILTVINLTSTAVVLATRETA